MTRKASKKSAGGGAGGASRRAVRPRSVRGPIHCIYLYYAKFKRSGKLEDLTSHYFLSGDQPIGNAANQIDALIMEMAAAPKYHYTCYGNSFMDMRRRRVSYFVVVVEDAQGRTLNSVQFIDDIANDDSNYDGGGRHTFERVDPRPLTVGGKTLWIATFIDRLMSKRHAGDTLHDGELEHFDLRLHFGDRGGRGGGHRGMIRGAYDDSYSFDSGGTNMGPPVPPPA